MTKHDVKNLLKGAPHCLSGGFTLLEVLVAVFIFAIVVTTIFGSFNLVIGNAGEIEKNTNLYEIGKNCLNRIQSDIHSLFIPLVPLYTPPEFNEDPNPYRFFGEKTTIDGIDFPRLQFAADAHLPFEGNTRTGMARIVYYVQKDLSDQYVLRRSDTLFPNEYFEENPNDPVICDNLRELSFTYYNKEGETFDYWDSDSEEFGYASPRGLKIVLKTGNEDNPITLETMISIPVYREKKTE